MRDSGYDSTVKAALQYPLTVSKADPYFSVIISSAELIYQGKRTFEVATHSSRNLHIDDKSHSCKDP